MTVATAEQTASPATLNDSGIFRMLGAGLDQPGERRELWPAAIMLFLAWLGFLAWIGPYVRSPVASAVLATVPRPLLLWGVPAVILIIAGVAWARGRRGLALLAVMVLAYHAGTGLMEVAYALTYSWRAGLPDATWVQFGLRRLLYGVAVCIPLALVWLLVFRRQGEFHLGFGDWRVLTRLSRKEPFVTWRQALGGITLAGVLPLFLLMQLVVGFEPIVTGAILGLILPILVISVINATVEEAIFRGFMLPAAVRAAGVPRGLWLIGIWFGLHHFGVSVQLLTSLPGALLIGIGSVVFGKSVLETRGLGWAIAAHTLLDIAIFSAFYSRF